MATSAIVLALAFCCGILNAQLTAPVNPFPVQMVHKTGHIDTIRVFYHKCTASVKTGICTEEVPKYTPRNKEFKFGDKKTIDIIGGPNEGSFKITRVKNNKDLGQAGSGAYFYTWVKTAGLSKTGQEYKKDVLKLAVHKEKQQMDLVMASLVGGIKKKQKQTRTCHIMEKRIHDEIVEGHAVLIDGDRVSGLYKSKKQPTSIATLPLLETQYEDNQYPTAYTEVAIGDIGAHEFPKANKRYFYAIYEGDIGKVRYVEETHDGKKIGHTSLAPEKDHAAIFQFSLHAIWGGHIRTGDDKKVKVIDNGSGHFQPYKAYSKIVYDAMGLTQNTHWTMAGQSAHAVPAYNHYYEERSGGYESAYDNAYDAKYDDEYDESRDDQNAVQSYQPQPAINIYTNDYKHDYKHSITNEYDYQSNLNLFMVLIPTALIGLCLITIICCLCFAAGGGLTYGVMNRGKSGARSGYKASHFDEEV